MALVLDEAGTPLPLPCEELVSDEAGRLELGRLPAGNLSVVALSCDLTRVGRGALSVPAGGEVALELALVDDPSELARALVLFGETDLAALARGDEGAR